jgi:hypothetical protein
MVFAVMNGNAFRKWIGRCTHRGVIGVVEVHGFAGHLHLSVDEFHGVMDGVGSAVGGVQLQEPSR